MQLWVLGPTLLVKRDIHKKVYLTTSFLKFVAAHICLLSLFLYLPSDLLRNWNIIKEAGNHYDLSAPVPVLGLRLW